MMSNILFDLFNIRRKSCKSGIPAAYNPLSHFVLYQFEV